MSLASLGALSFNVIRYSTGLQSRLVSGQTLTTSRHTSVKVVQPGLSVTIQCRSQAEYRRIQDYLREHQITLIGDGSVKPLRFQYTAARLDYLVFVPRVPGGARRFEYAPTMTLNFLLVKDLINTTGAKFSTGEAWTGVYQGEIREDESESIGFVPPSNNGLPTPTGSNTGFPGLGAPGFIQPDQRGNGGLYLPGIGG